MTNEKENPAIPLIAVGAGLLAGLIIGFILSAPEEKKQSQAAPGNRG